MTSATVYANGKEPVQIKMRAMDETDPKSATAAAKIAYGAGRPAGLTVVFDFTGCEWVWKGTATRDRWEVGG